MLRQSLLCTFVLLSITCIKAQPTEYDPGCEKLHEQIIEQFGLAKTAADTFARLDPVCAGWVLSDLSFLTALSGRNAEAEILAERALKLLTITYGPEDRRLLRPLYVVFNSRIEGRKLAMARQTLRDMQRVRTKGPEDEAMVHTATATLLHREHKPDAEAEYLAAFAALVKAGRENTTDAATILCGLGEIYIDTYRLPEAARALDRSWVALVSASDAVPQDRIKILQIRGHLAACQVDWKAAREFLEKAVAIMHDQVQLDEHLQANVLLDYAQALRKTGSRQDARSFQKTAANLDRRGFNNTLVDAIEACARRKSCRSPWFSVLNAWSLMKGW